VSSFPDDEKGIPSQETPVHLPITLNKSAARRVVREAKLEPSFIGKSELGKMTIGLMLARPSNVHLNRIEALPQWCH